MTNKFREKFFYTILTNIVSVLVILILPLFFGDNHIIQWYYQKISILFTSYRNECIFIALMIGVILCLYTIRNHKKKEAVAEKVIHEAFNYQEILKTKEKEREEIIQETKKAIRDYLRISLCPYIQENEMGKLIQNIDKWDNTKGYILLPVITDGRLSTLDLRHMIWNVGKRLGWNGNKCATFIKVCFPIELKDLEIETIRRNLRQRGNCIIDIDIPECGDYKFHINHTRKSKL